MSTNTRFSTILRSTNTRFYCMIIIFLLESSYELFLAPHRLLGIWNDVYLCIWRTFMDFCCEIMKQEILISHLFSHCIIKIHWIRAQFGGNDVKDFAKMIRMPFITTYKRTSSCIGLNQEYLSKTCCGWDLFRWSKSKLWRRFSFQNLKF